MIEKFKYVNTLDISQIPIYNVHAQNDNSETPQKDRRGLIKMGRTIPEALKGVIKLINSFSYVESHYCRQRTS